MGRNRTYDRSNILDLAMQTFWRFGYGATTIATLVESTGVDKKTLFREFKNKEQLFADALRLYVQGACKHIDSRLTVNPLGLNNVRSYLDSMTMWATHPICLLTKALSEFELLSDEHRQIVGGALAYQENRFRENVKAAIDGNELPTGTQVRKVVKYLMYSVWGISSMGHFEGSKPTLRLVSEAIMEGMEKNAALGRI